MSRIQPLLVCALLLLVACSGDEGSASATRGSEIEFTTASGMEVRMLPAPGSGLFASNVFVGAGSTREDDSSAGSSHFLEHLLFNGTSKRTQEEIYAEADRLGAYNNATTKWEYTHYMMVAPSEEFDGALDIQADMLLHSTLPPEKFEKERGIVLEEMSKDGDDPQTERRHRITEAFFGADSDFARPVLGTAETISSLNRDQVLTYYHRQYVPSNMKLLLMGDFDPAAARKRIEELFAAEPGEARPAPDWKAPESAALYRIQLEDEAMTVALQMPAPAVGDADLAPYLLLVDILGGGESSRLRRAVDAEPSLGALEIGASVQNVTGGSILSVEGRFPLGTDVDEALRRILEEIATLAATGVRAAEWSSAQNRALSETVRQVEQLHYYALLQGDRIWHAPAGFERAFQEQIETSHDAMSRVAGRWFDPAQLRVVIAGPEVQVDGHADLDPAAAGFVARAGEQSGSPLPGGGVVEHRPPTVDSEQAPSVTVLDNGLTVIHSASPQTRMFAMHLLVRDRSAREPEGAAGIADLLHRTLPQGAGNYDRDEWNAMLDGIGAQWKVTDSAFIPYDDYYGTDPAFSFVRLDCVDLYWKEAVRLMGLMIGDAHLEDDAIQRSRDEMAQRQARDAQSPSTQSRSRFAALLLGADHPWTRPIFGEPGGLDAVDQKALQAFALDYLDPGQLVLSVVGNIDRDALLQEVRARFDIGAASDHVSVEAPGLPLTTAEQREEIALGGQQASLRMGRILDVEEGDRWALEVATMIASSRMQQDLRETRGLAYSLGIGSTFDGGRARISASIGTRPENVEEVETALRGYLTLGTLEVTPDEIAAVVNGTLGRSRMRRVTSIGRAYNLGHDYAFAGGLDYDRRRSDGLRAVTPADVERAAERYFAEGPLVTVVAR